MSVSIPSRSATRPHSLHAVYLRVLCDLLAERQLDVPGLVAAAGLARANLGESASAVNMSQVLTLLRLVGHQCKDPLLPIQWGRRVRPSMHGTAGVAVFSSRDVRQALETACESAPLRGTAFQLVLSESADSAYLACEPTMPLHELHDFLMTAKAFLIIQILWGLLGRQIAEVCVEFPFPAPGWAAEREGHCPSQARFGAKRLGFSFPAALLGRPLPSADAHAHDAALHQCRLDLLGSDISFAARVQAFIACRPETHPYPSLDDTAAHFCVSPRSLRRALQSEGQTFQVLFDSARMEFAQRLLEDTELSVQQISGQIGYADPSNFVRAFRRMTGQTPRQWRFDPASPRSALQSVTAD
jgi:AraC-like DNA-binding protein